MKLKTLLPNGYRRSRVSAFASAAIVAMAVTCGGTQLQAQITWNGAGGDGNWFNGGNWIGGVAPNGTSTDAVVGAPSSVLLNGNININSLTVDAAGVVNIGTSQNLDFGGTATTTLNNAGTINVGNNADFRFRNTVINSGDININAAGNNSDIEIDALGASLSGGGTITLNGVSAGITGLSGATLTIVDQTIQGQGSIGENTIGIVNQANGLIDANVSGELLTFDAAATGASNAGTIQASGGGVLVINGSIVDNTDGQITAQNGSTVQLNASTITNGTLSSVGTGQLSVVTSANVFLEDVAINGNLVANNNSDTGISGTINNAGSIEIVAGGSNTDIEIQTGNATLTGGGTVTLTGSTAGINGLSGTVLTIGDQTIQGEGSIGENLIGVINSSTGVVDANVAMNTLTINSSTDGVDNDGVIKATNEGTLRFLDSNVDNDGGQIVAEADSTVSFSASTITGGTLNTTGTGELVVEVSSNVRFEDITNNGNLFSQNNSDTELLGTINNAGSIEIVAGGNNTDIEVQIGNATLTGGGTVTLTGINAGINGLSGTVLTIGDQTIQGEGSIGENLIGVINSADGLVDANVSGQVLNIDTNSTTNFTNNGTLRASDGGVLRVSSTQLNNNSVTEALDGSRVELTNSTITGGTLRSVGTGSVDVTTSTNTFLEDVSIEGNLRSFNNSDTGILGTINNSGLVEITAGSSSTDIEVQAGGATLTGGGTVRLSGTNAGINGVGGAVLDIASQLVIGQGSLGENTIEILNGVGGTIEADVFGASLTIDTLGANASTFFTNNGTLRASNGGNLVSLQGVINNGTIDTGAGSEVQALTLTNEIGSVLSGSGFVDVDSGQISVAGTVAPGNLAGILTLLDDTDFLSTAVLQTELESDSLFDILDVDGNLTLDGLLEVSLLSSFNPLSSDVFSIISAADITGQFANAADGATLLTTDGTGSFIVNYGSTNVTLSNFTLTAVPEPSSIVCLIGLAAGLLIRRRRAV